MNQSTSKRKQDTNSPHKRNSSLFWKTKEDFAQKYNVDFNGFNEEAAETRDGQEDQAISYFESVFSVLRSNQNLVDYIADTLVGLGDSVPEKIESCKVTINNPAKDPEIFNVDSLPNDLFVDPGSKAPNRVGFSKYASFINSTCISKYGRPLVVAMSADLADSTNISGFAKGYGDSDDMGLYNYKTNKDSPLIPQGITEFTNSGMLAGLATVNFCHEPYKDFNGFYGAMSTYGSFSYLKYGPIRLFSQLAQDSNLKVGKLLWIAGHS